MMSENRNLSEMLTDIFAYRYLENPIWEQFDERARRLLVRTTAMEIRMMRRRNYGMSLINS